MRNRKLDTPIRIKLTLGDWREVICALENSSSEIYNRAAITNNVRHARAWERDSDRLERLAAEIALVIDNTTTVLTRTG